MLSSAALGASALAPPFARDVPAGLAAAVGAMRADLSRNHTVSRLAKSAGMSRSRFAHAFRSCFGRSPIEYLRGLRLEYAAELLRSGEVPVKLIGARVGYTSRTAFAQAFRQTFGVSPTAFRGSSPQLLSDDIHAVSQRLRDTKGGSTELAWEVDLATGKVWWSEGTFLSLGFKANARIVSDVVRFHARVHPEDRKRVVASMQAACMGQQLTWQAEFRFLGANGHYELIRNGSVILRDRDGLARRLLGAMQIATR